MDLSRFQDEPYYRSLSDIACALDCVSESISQMNFGDAKNKLDRLYRNLDRMIAAGYETTKQPKE